MGTSLSGLTPATTFDGLLKVGDNDPLTADLKAISTGDGADTMLELSTSALQIGGATGMYWDNTNKRLGIGTNTPISPLQITKDNGASNGSKGLVFGDNFFRIGNFFNVGILDAPQGSIYMQTLGVGIGLNYTEASSVGGNMLGIKGSGATSATTSLLVQNSAGTNIFKVVDDNTMFYHTHKFRSAGGYLYIDGEGNPDRSLKIGQSFTASSYGGHIFKTYDGTAYTEAMRITGANDQFVGIGETTPTARLHLKGSGNDNTTTSLLVQNSDGHNALKVSDDGRVRIENNHTTNKFIIGWPDGSESLIFDYTSIRTGGGNPLFVNGSTTHIGSAGGTRISAATTGTTIFGSGATSATTALLVQNSAGTELLKVRDDGTLLAPQAVIADFIFNVSTLMPNNSQSLGSNTSLNRHFTNAYFKGVAHITDNVISNTTYDASAKLQVDSTTKGFLPPRMTTTERDAISTPAAGLMVYNTDTNTAECWNGSAWMPMF